MIAQRRQHSITIISSSQRLLVLALTLRLHLRRRSAVTAVAMTRTAWLLERQPHLHTLLLYIAAPSSRVAFHVTERAITLRITVAGDEEADDEIVTIPLDCSIRMKEPATTTPTPASPSSSSSPSTPSSPPPSTDSTLAALSVHKALSSCLVKLPLQSSPSTPPDSSASSFPNAAELRPSNYPSLLCRACGSRLLANPPSSCLPLPSTFWSEMVDLWYCHTEGNAKLDRLSASNVAVGEGRLLVGLEDVRVRMEDVVEASVLVDDEWREERRERVRGHGCHTHPHGDRHRHEEKEASAAPCEERKEDEKEEVAALLPSTIYRRARCARCRVQLGSAVSFSQPSSPSSSSSASSHHPSPPPPSELHLLKHRIDNAQQGSEELAQDALASQMRSLSLSSSPSPPPLPSLFLSFYTLETHLAAHLLSLCHARCTFRFILRTPARATPTSTQSAPTIHLTLLNLDTSIRSNNLPGSSSSAPAPPPVADVRMRPVLKVAYDVLVGEGGECGEDGGESPAKGKKTRRFAGEAVELPDADVRAVAVLLEEASSLLPFEFRHMAGTQTQRLAFLRQLSDVV